MGLNPGHSVLGKADKNPRMRSAVACCCLETGLPHILCSPPRRRRAWRAAAQVGGRIAHIRDAGPKQAQIAWAKENPAGLH